MKHITLCCLHDQLNNLIIHKLDNDQLFMVMNTVLLITQISHGNLVNKNTATGMLIIYYGDGHQTNSGTSGKSLCTVKVLISSFNCKYIYPGSNKFRKESLKVPNCPQLSIIILKI